MSDVVVVAIIAASPGIIATIVGLLNRAAVKDVHLSLNSRLDKMIELSANVAHAKGVADQVAIQNAAIAANKDK
jgi:hypothetical protein